MKAIYFLSSFQLHSNKCLFFFTFSDSMNIFSLLPMMTIFPLSLYVFNGLNEIKIILIEGVVYLFYTQNTHKWSNKNSQYFLAPMASKVNKQTWNKQTKKFRNVCNKTKLLEKDIHSFILFLSSHFIVYLK